MSTAKLLIKRWVLPMIVLQPLQPFYRILHRVALAGMNIGPVGEVATSGEGWLVRKLLKKAPEGAVIVDVGANVGEFTLICLKEAKKALRLFAFEPSPSIYERLVANLKAVKRKDDVTLVQKGLSNRAGTATISVVPGLEGNSSLRPRHQEHLSTPAKVETIELTTLDLFCEESNIAQIYFLKVDIEGEEFACLKGADRMLKERRIEYLQFEFGGCNIQSRVFFRDFWELLSPNYELFRILQHSLQPLKKYHELQEIFTTTNFLAIRKQVSD